MLVVAADVGRNEVYCKSSASATLLFPGVQCSSRFGVTNSHDIWHVY